MFSPNLVLIYALQQLPKILGTCWCSKHPTELNFELLAPGVYMNNIFLNIIHVLLIIDKI